MMNVVGEMLRITSKLNDANADYAVCGGLALAIHGFPRATKDVDLLVRAEDLQRHRTLLQELDYRIDGGTKTLHKGTTKESRTCRISRAVDDELWSVDFVVMPDSFRDVWLNPIDVEFRNQRFRVISADGLRKMKESTRDLQDLADLENLNDPDV